MKVRWRRTPKVIDVDEHVGQAVHVGGRWTRDVLWTLDPETTARVRLGYVCIDCMEPHEQAFPRKCSLCGFPMYEWQSAEFGRRYQGEERLKGAGIAEDMARMIDKEERAKRARQASSSQILLPANVAKQVKGKT